MPIITAIRNACEKVVHYSDSYFFHAYHKQWTAKILHVMGEYNSQKLTPKLKKLADDYSVEVFGRTSRPNVHDAGSETGPFDRRANGLGLDDFYGLNAGDTSQYGRFGRPARAYPLRKSQPRCRDQVIPTITCPSTSPTTRSSGCKGKKPLTPISHSSFTWGRPRPIRLTKPPGSGSTS